MMADLSQYFGSDLVFSAGGDLLMTQDLDTETTQRVVRRLLTAPGSYIWILSFGAGLPQQVGLPSNILAVKKAIRAQIFADPGVAAAPEPTVTLTGSNDGTFTADITFTSAVTGQSVPFSVALN